MRTANEWGGAFARQAKADFEAWKRLQGITGIAQCHKLHFLQMACEKLAKGHLCKAGADPYRLQSSHAYLAKNLPIIARQELVRISGKRPDEWDYVLRQIRHLARKIEILSPSVDDDGKRPDNCEYPWEDSAGKLHVPAEHTFTNLTLLTAPAGRIFLKILNTAITRLA